MAASKIGHPITPKASTRQAVVAGLHDESPSHRMANVRPTAWQASVQLHDGRQCQCMAGIRPTA
eukprot:357607-Chlamydomonas_euryale.AAC.7